MELYFTMIVEGARSEETQTRQTENREYFHSAPTDSFMTDNPSRSASL